MSVVSGSKIIFPKVNFSSSTTAEEMRTYLKAAADVLCEVTGLVITKTEEHDYGGVYYIGETAESNPILCVWNQNYSNYFTRIAIGLVGNDYKPPVSLVNSINSSSLIQFYYSPSSLNSYDYLVNYVKFDDGSILIGFVNSSSSRDSLYLFCITKCSVSDGELLTAVGFNSNGCSSSYFVGQAVTASYINSLSWPTDISMLCSPVKKIISDFWPFGIYFKRIKYSSGMYDAGKYIDIDGKRYISMYKTTYGSLLLDVTQN